MSLSVADMAFAQELFADIPNLTTRHMLGGMGLYCSAVIFAVQLSDGRIMLKATVASAAHMATFGGTKWTYTRKNSTPSAIPYWTLSDTCMDDPEAANALTREALDALTGQEGLLSNPLSQTCVSLSCRIL